MIRLLLRPFVLATCNCMFFFPLFTACKFCNLNFRCLICSSYLKHYPICLVYLLHDRLFLWLIAVGKGIGSCWNISEPIVFASLFFRGTCSQVALILSHFCLAFNFFDLAFVFRACFHFLCNTCFIEHFNEGTCK